MPAAQIANGIGMSLQMSFRHRCALCGGRASRSSGPAVGLRRSWTRRRPSWRNREWV